ncbi:hypothetical protein D8I35_04910 [Corticibacter populi]|uniref:Uncharacterized protein n=1 Tax=Corticibacter populi TaxID=1550736 RepID=A0A3M6QZG8_9BURK|nr:hypothetical protein [Corticibacter populi]RMX08426.1 hypothetical protein D8I35_04910 [Corticibacter populi]RZS35732.1 hypothetical protein EV687_0810 [Corticibacter populi]
MPAESTDTSAPQRGIRPRRPWLAWLAGLSVSIAMLALPLAIWLWFSPSGGGFWSGMGGALAILVAGVANIICLLLNAGYAIAAAQRPTWLAALLAVQAVLASWFLLALAGVL